MRAVRRSNNEVYLDTNAPEPTIGDGQALIRPLRVLIAPTDVAVCSGVVDHEGILGHQFVGVVEACADEGWVGKRVVGNIHINAPQSPLARRGLGNHDPERSILGLRGRDGCLCDHFVLETRNLYAVPDSIDDEHACLSFALARAIHAGQVAHIQGKPFVSVLGAGLVGLLSAQVMSQKNASVRLLSSSPDRLELCAKWGVKHRALHEVGRRHDQDVVIETSGKREALGDALRMVRPLGTIVLAGSPVPLVNEPIPVDHALIADKEIRLVGARCGQVNEGIGVMSSGEIDLSGLVTKRYRFDDAIAAIRAASDDDQIAVIVQMD